MCTKYSMYMCVHVITRLCGRGRLYSLCIKSHVHGQTLISSNCMYEKVYTREYVCKRDCACLWKCICKYFVCACVCVLQTDGWGKDTKALTRLDWFDNLVIDFFKANDKHQQPVLPAVTVIGLHTRFPRAETRAPANQRRSAEVDCGDVPSAVKKPDHARLSHFTLSY